MMMRFTKPKPSWHLWLVAGLITGGRAVGQTVAPLVQALDTYRQTVPQEKLFVHTDQAFYLTGETLWCKIYYVDGSLHRPYTLSKVAYLDILNAEGQPVLQTKVELAKGGGAGSLFLPTTILSGTYRLRGYTRWMQNFGPGYFFEKTITIINPFRQLGFSGPALTEMPTVGVFPEGGQLVQGLPGRVAFHVTDSTGHGVSARGWLLNAKSDTLARLQTGRFGLGAFGFTPAELSGYRVQWVDEKGHTFSTPLPAAQAQGYVMQVESVDGNQLKITVRTNRSDASTVYLLGHTRHVLGVAEARQLQHGEAQFLVDKNTLGEGVSHLTVFDANQQPVCERLVFRKPQQQLTVSLKTDAPSYPLRSKVSVSVGTTYRQAKAAAVSMAVYKLDAPANPDSVSLPAALWLTSDLPGFIESPDYYLRSAETDVAQATDWLMMTHGWRKFNWRDYQSGKPKPLFSFLPEPNNLLVEGQLTDPVTHRPVPNKLTYLATPGKPVRLYVSQSDSAGRVRYEVEDFYGPHSVIALTEPADSMYKIQIQPPFAAGTRRAVAEPQLTENDRAALTERSIAMQTQNTYWGSRTLRYRYPAIDSTAFYGKPPEHYLLDTYTRFPRMEEVLREYVQGVMPRKKQNHFEFHILNLPERTAFDNHSLVLLDGVPIFDMDKLIDYNPLKVKQIDVVTNRYLMGPTLFNGIASFQTYKGDLSGFSLDPHLLKVEYDGLQVLREFAAPMYQTPTQKANRLFDGRTLLYWNPTLHTSASGHANADFYTSDQPGLYVVEVNALTDDGTAGYGRATFVVKPQLP